VEPAAEAEYRLHSSLERLERPGWMRLDAVLFANNFLVMAVAPRSFRRAGVEGEVAPVVAAAAAYGAAAAVYVWRTRSPRVEAAVARWRLAAQTGAYLLAAALFARHMELPNLCVTCSVVLPDGEPVELLAAYLLWLAAYAPLAAIPLAVAVPCQLASATALLWRGNLAPCVRNVKIGVCHATYDHYRRLVAWMGRAGAGLSFARATPLELAQGVPACGVVISVIKVRAARPACAVRACSTHGAARPSADAPLHVCRPARPPAALPLFGIRQLCHFLPGAVDARGVGGLHAPPLAGAGAAVAAAGGVAAGGRGGGGLGAALPRLLHGTAVAGAAL
jgi:hypothetical protein